MAFGKKENHQPKKKWNEFYGQTLDTAEHHTRKLLRNNIKKRKKSDSLSERRYLMDQKKKKIAAFVRIFLMMRSYEMMRYDGTVIRDSDDIVYEKIMTLWEDCV